MSIHLNISGAKMVNVSARAGSVTVIMIVVTETMEQRALMRMKKNVNQVGICGCSWDSPHTIFN